MQWSFVKNLGNEAYETAKRINPTGVVAASIAKYRAARTEMVRRSKLLNSAAEKMNCGAS